jgi:hypothetical protein
VFVENAGWKIDQFRIATGEVLGAAGSDANLEAEDCLQRRGEIEIGTDEFPKHSGRMRNVVLNYSDPKRNAKAGQTKPAAVSTKRIEPDDIPF